MTAATALARLRDLGVSIAGHGDRLTLRPASALPPDLLADLRTHKAEVLALLAANDPAIDPGATAERAAIEAEPPLPARGTQERARTDARQAATVSGLLAAGLVRPPSWWDSEPHDPTPGATCSACRGRDWWTRDRRGWCCATCHPRPTQLDGGKPDGAHH